jgi:REP element-mobilizing transposase RayT
MRGLLHPRIYNRVSVQSRGYLPHWTVDEGLYFVTFRLADSLPKHVYGRIRDETRAFQNALTRCKPTAIERDKIRRFLFARVDEHLDSGFGSCWMQRPAIAKLVADALKFFDGRRYDLLAWCVMPNHVHVVAQTKVGETLDGICGSWKSYTAREANRILGREGRFWEREYFDRLIRNDQDLENTVSYVLHNPSKAGLADWPWVGGG